MRAIGRPGRRLSLLVLLLVLAVCFYALLIAASLSIQTDSAALPLERSSLRASLRHARQELPSKPAEQLSSPPPSDAPPSLPPPWLPRYPPPPPSQPFTPTRHLPRRPMHLSPPPLPLPPPPSPTPTLPPPPPPSTPTLTPPSPTPPSPSLSPTTSPLAATASAQSSAPHPRHDGRHVHAAHTAHTAHAAHGHGRPRRFVPQVHGWEEDSPQRRLRVAVRPLVARIVSSRFVCATLDWWPSAKCDYGRCPWRGASLLEAIRP